MTDSRKDRAAAEEKEPSIVITTRLPIATGYNSLPFSKTLVFPVVLNQNDSPATPSIRPAVLVANLRRDLARRICSESAASLGISRQRAGKTGPAMNNRTNENQSRDRLQNMRPRRS